MPVFPGGAESTDRDAWKKGSLILPLKTGPPVGQKDDIPGDCYFETGLSYSWKVIFQVIIVVDQHDALLDRRGVGDIVETHMNAPGSTLRKLTVVKDRSPGKVLTERIFKEFRMEGTGVAPEDHLITTGRIAHDESPRVLSRNVIGSEDADANRAKVVPVRPQVDSVEISVQGGL
jgi:hypothetical protein